MRIINKQLYEEISLKLDRVNRNPKLFEQRKRITLESLKSLGDLYSWWIENPGLRKALLLENRKPETIKKKAREGVHGIQNAWYYLTQKEKGGRFMEVLDESVLKKVNSLLEPKLDGAGDFRRRDATLFIEGYTPASWEKIPKKISEAILKIKEHYRENPLESAIMAHFEIARIQPFIEGNKRTGRLLQNKILSDLEIPPVVIPAGEGKFYFDLLKRIFPNYDKNDPETFRQFYDYCASKVNNGLDFILNDLNKIPTH